MGAATNSHRAVRDQLIMKSTTICYAAGSIIAESHEQATGLMVITSGSVGVELPLDSSDANGEHGSTLLYVLGRGCATRSRSELGVHVLPQNSLRICSIEIQPRPPIKRFFKQKNAV